MSSLKSLKKIYDKLKSDRIRGTLLATAEYLGMPKDIVRMDTNGYCNIRCIMCNQSSRTAKKQFMPLDNYKKIIDTFASTTRMLYLSCAYEPLITPHFSEYLAYAKQKRIPHVSFCTNALLLNKELITCMVDLQIDEIIISFNGFCESDYNRIMEGSNYQRVCANLKALCEYKREKNAAKPHIRLNTVLLKSNLEHTGQIFDFLVEYDIDTVQFRELMLLTDQNNSDAVKEEMLSNLTPAEYEEVVHNINILTEKLKLAGKEIILPAAFWEYKQQEQPLAAPAPSDSPSGTTSDTQSGATPDISSGTTPDIPSDTPPVQSEQNLNLQKKHNSSKSSCSIPCFSYWIDRDGGVRVCGFDDNGIIGNALLQSSKELKARRKAFQKMALSGECSRELCTMNIDSSKVL